MVKESIRKFRAPEIINTDQGSQYTTKAWEALLTENGALIIASRKSLLRGATDCYGLIA